MPQDTIATIDQRQAVEDFRRNNTGVVLQSLQTIGWQLCGETIEASALQTIRQLARIIVSQCDNLIGTEE
jgi:hypothetical protein